VSVLSRVLVESAESLSSWWRGRQRQCFNGEAWSQNALVAADLDLRRRLAPALSDLYPSQGTCGRCHWPWAQVESHSLDYTERKGCFPICEWCFKQLSNEGSRDEYVGYYMALVKSWEAECLREGWTEDFTETRRQIIAALEVEWPSRMSVRIDAMSQGGRS
jgi:hypothetical protein